MSSTPRGTPSAEVMGLCLSCGLCCDGTIFGKTRLRPEESRWAKAHRLPLLPDQQEPAFRQPCELLIARGDERACGDYANRPQACRAFVCQLATQYEAGTISKRDASRIVERARVLVAHIGERPDPGRNAEALLDAGELRRIVRRYFFAPEKPAGHDETGEKR